MQVDEAFAMLKLTRDAPAELARKAYLILSKEFHPDKNRNDASATASFQQLGEANSVVEKFYAKNSLKRAAEETQAPPTKISPPVPANSVKVRSALAS